MRLPCALRNHADFIRARAVTPSFPSRNPSKHDLHRLAIGGFHFRSYSTQVAAGRPNSRNSFRDPGDLVLSDAQRRTIYALSTPPGKAGVAVVRISGPGASDVWKRMVKSPKKRRTMGDGRVRPEVCKMARCAIVDPETEEVLDEGLAVFFKAPKSFTTEDVLELHTHSGRALISSVLSSLSRLPSCRPAEPGEFTRRAFEGGRLDLTQVEGLKDLIDADTEGQRRVALRAARGATRAQFDALRADIIQCLAMVEALIDFGEGEEIEEGVYDQAREKVLNVHHTVQSCLSDHRRGEIIRSGIRLAIFGPPNVGKSSLLNFLAQREAAIVTPVPGTTRDILELSVDIGGLPVIVADTAGLRNTHDLVEGIGIERAKKAIKDADVSLCVLSLPELVRDTPDGHHRVQLPPSICQYISEHTFVLLNKSDLVSARLANSSDIGMGERAWTVSLSTGDGMAEFTAGFAQALQQRYGLSDDSSQVPMITHARHRVHLESALRFLEAFFDTPPEDIVLAAEELRYAAQAVGKISGAIVVDDILDAIFKDFCIGK